MSESTYTKKILPEWQKKHPGARVMRNNTGMAWQGNLFTTLLNGIAEKVLKNLRPIFFGVGIPVKDKKTGQIIQKGGGDYIGWESFKLCDLIPSDFNIPGCNCNCSTCGLNKKIAVFLNLEIKSKDGKESPDQIKFRKKVIAAGGISIVLQEGKDETL